MREPGQVFLEMARKSVLVVEREDWGREDWRIGGGTRFYRLTDLVLLDRSIPANVPGTLYHFFSTTSERDTVAVVEVDVVNEAIVERAAREAALGMMDSPVYR
ncbi:MAG: hypothetical protein CEN92_436 [Candidatus Berkelbacteria bacterium Licking1014_96]|uniref:Uncharacterized protein n=1 Tax=Candidatus Berkelbacteria bacterium Licking1014_96 TaxID=2017149 RepID=A0A554LCY4_9BACT|nr:MAG: hypothetical protein CEN92_436 [Candidatus Berkelbacteria bacterium Licking1014_96]